MSVGAMVAGVLMTLIGAWRIGVTTDEPVHVQRYNNLVDTGWYVPDGNVIDGELVDGAEYTYVYSPATMRLLQTFSAVLNVDDEGYAEATRASYVVRHLGIGFIGLGGVAAVVLTGRLLLRRWDWALVGGASLATVPLWAGHAMFNVKDVPVATGYTVATLGLVILARELQGASWLLRLGGPAALALGILLSVGTRPAMWASLAASLAALVGLRLLRPGGSPLARFRADLWCWRDIGLSLVASALGLWALYPKVFSSPVEALWKAAFESAGFLGISSHRLFVPMHVLMQMPLVMQALWGYGVWVVARAVLRARLRLDVTQTRLVLVGVQVVTLPVIAVVTQPTLYGDLRQLLFAVPGTVLLATYGTAHLLERARKGRDHRGPALVTVTVCAGLVVPTVSQALLFPYNYTWYNPLIAVAQVPTYGEYSRASARALAPDIPSTGRLVCAAVGFEGGETYRVAQLDGWVDCRTSVSSPVSPYRDEMSHEPADLGPDDFLAVTFRESGEIGSNCQLVKEQDRWGLWRTVALATLARCTLPVEVLGSQQIRIDVSPEATGLALPDTGWFAPYGGIRSRGGTSTLSFKLAPELRGKSVLIEVEVETAFKVGVRFGGREVPVDAFDGDTQRLLIRVPAELVDEGIARTLPLEFRERDTNLMRLVVRGLRATPAG